MDNYQGGGQVPQQNTQGTAMSGAPAQGGPVMRAGGPQPQGMPSGADMQRAAQAPVGGPQPMPVRQPGFRTDPKYNQYQVCPDYYPAPRPASLHDEGIDDEKRKKQVNIMGICAFIAAILVCFGNFTFGVINERDASDIWFKITLPIWMAALVVAIVGLIFAAGVRKRQGIRHWPGFSRCLASTIMLGCAPVATMLGLMFHLVYFY